MTLSLDRNRILAIRSAPSHLHFPSQGLLFDSYDDDAGSDNPIIMAWQNNGTQLFHHDTDGLGTRFGGCRAKYRNRAKPVGVKVSYEEEAHTFKVQLNMGGKAGWEACVAKDGIKLPKNGYFGFSAANRKDAEGDKHVVKSFRMWDLKKKYDDEAAARTASEKAFAADADNGEAHPLIDKMQGATTSLQDTLLENLKDQVTRDRAFKISEFGSVHVSLNEVASFPATPPCDATNPTLLKSLNRLLISASRALSLIRH